MRVRVLAIGIVCASIGGALAVEAGRHRPATQGPPTSHASSSVLGAASSPPQRSGTTTKAAAPTGAAPTTAVASTSWPTPDRRNGESDDTYRLRSEQVQRLNEWRDLAQLTKEQEARVLSILAEGERMNVEAWEFAEKSIEEHDSAKRLVQSLKNDETTTPEVRALAAEELDTDPMFAGKEVEAWVDAELQKVLTEQQFYRWKRTFPLYWSLFSRSLQVFTWKDNDTSGEGGT